MTTPTHTIPANTRAHLDFGLCAAFTVPETTKATWDGERHEDGRARVTTDDGTPLLVHRDRLVAIEGGAGDDEVTPAKPARKPVGAMDCATYEAYRQALRSGDPVRAKAIHDAWQVEVAEAQTRIRVEASARLAEQEQSDSESDAIIKQMSAHVRTGPTSAQMDAAIAIIDIYAPVRRLTATKWWAASDTNTDKPYTVTEVRGVIKGCTCRGNSLGKHTCKHMTRVKMAPRWWGQICLWLRQGVGAWEIVEIWTAAVRKRGVTGAMCVVAEGRLGANGLQEVAA